MGRRPRARRPPPADDGAAGPAGRGAHRPRGGGGLPFRRPLRPGRRLPDATTAGTRCATLDGGMRAVGRRSADRWSTRRAAGPGHLRPTGMERRRWSSRTAAPRRPARAHPRRVPARPRRGRRRPGVRRPADPGRAPGLRTRPPARPHQQRPRPGQRAVPSPSWTRWTSARGTRARAGRRRAAGRVAHPAAHPGPAAGRGARRRPAGPAADRDEAPDPVRRGRRAPAGRRCCAGTGWPSPAPDEPGAGHRDVVLAAGGPPGPRPGPDAAHRAAAGGAAARAALGRLPFGARIAGPGIGLVRARPRAGARLRAAGNQVYVWTVNEPADLELVLDAGVDGIITDRPAYVLARLGR